MKKHLCSTPVKFILITLVINFCATSCVKAQERIVTLSGYTADVIADTVLNTLPIGLTSSSIDMPADSGYVFFAQGYSSNSVPFTNGLPANGQFTSSAGHNFQLAPYNANNDLRLEVLQSGTLTFAIPDQIAYDSLYVLGTAGNGYDYIDYTINFTDATTSTGSLLFYDWLCNNCTPYAVKDLYRMGRIYGGIDSANQFAIREYPISLSGGDQAKHIMSIDFSAVPTSTGVANILGITGFTLIALPITLEYFTTRVENGKALLQWKTSQEISNKQFIIERSASADPSAFVAIGEVKAISANGSIYHFTNEPGLSGTYLYRLSQEDFDGNRKILGTKSITIKGKIKWAVQDLGSEWKLVCEQPFTYRLLDLHGRVLKVATGSGSATISKPASQGIYQIQVQTGGELSTQKLLK